MTCGTCRFWLWNGLEEYDFEGTCRRRAPVAIDVDPGDRHDGGNIDPFAPGRFPFMNADNAGCGEHEPAATLEFVIDAGEVMMRPAATTKRAA